MKKIITLLSAMFCVLTIFAQDIIITKDSKRIEAKILEVSSTEIKYKKQTNIDGPTFVELLSNVSAIMYSNGDVESFNSDDVKKETPIFNTLETTNQLPYITKIGQNSFVTSDNIHMSSVEFKSYLEKNCTGAYDVWVSGEQLRGLGWSFFGVGLGFDFLSIILSYTTDNPITVFTTGTIGSLLEIACIPTLIVGYKRKQKAVNYYNGFCSKKNSNVAINFGVAPNQVGCILSF